MKKIFLILVFLAFTFTAISVAKRFSYIKIPIEFSKANGNPLIKVEVENNSYSLIVGFANPVEFSFKTDVLERFSKKEPLNARSVVRLSGEREQSKKFLLERIKIGSSEVVHPAIDEELEELTEGSGYIGRNILSSEMLLLDFSNEALFLCKNRQSLILEGYSFSDFWEVDFEMNRWGVVFSIETEGGLKKLSLDTETPLSSLRKDTQDSKNKLYKISRFDLDGHDLGVREVELVEMSPIIDDIDGFIGRDFLNKHIILFDFKNKKAFIRSANKSNEMFSFLTLLRL